MSEKNRFPHLVAFRVDEPTHTKLTTVAEVAGMPVGIWVRALVLKAVDSQMRAPKVRRAAANTVQLHAILEELKAQDRNLNQIARAANANPGAAQIAADVALMRASLEALISCILDLLRIEDDA